MSKRIEGCALSTVWPSLSWTGKADAVAQIVNIANAVHAVDTAAVGASTLATAWYSVFDMDASLSDVKRYVKQQLFTREQGRALCAVLERFYAAREAAVPVLNHGDITMDNLLWRDGHIVSLLDFEHAVIAPPQLDAHSLLNLAMIPDEPEGSDGLDARYCGDVLAVLRPLIQEQRGADLVLGCALLFRQRFMEFWLESPEGPLERCDAYNKLVSLADGQGGYLAPYLPR